MRLESCRKCGNELGIKEKCNVCREPTTFQCNTCHLESDEQIHLNCKLIEMDYKLLEIRTR